MTTEDKEVGQLRSRSLKSRGWLTTVMTEADKGATKEGCGHAVVERVCTIMVVDFSFISRRGRSENATTGLTTLRQEEMSAESKADVERGC